MTLNKDISLMTDLHNGFYPTIGISNINCEVNNLSITPKYCLENINIYVLEASVNGTFKLFRNNQLVFTKTVLAYEYTFVKLAPPFYDNIFEINFIATSNTTVDNTYGVIGSLSFINESGIKEYFITNEYWVCNSNSATKRSANNTTTTYITSKSQYAYLYAYWIWDYMKRRQINCVEKVRIENKYINSDQTCP